MTRRVTSTGATRITSSGAERTTSTPEPVVLATLPRDVRRPLADVRLELLEDGADLVLEDGDLRIEEGLRTAVVASLFSDARAEEKDPLPPEEISRRGWWADSAGDRFGSLFWLLQREKVTTATMERARQYARAALQWMIEDGIAQRVDVEVERLAQGTIGIKVRLQRGTARRWSGLWEATEREMQATVEGVAVRILTA